MAVSARNNLPPDSQAWAGEVKQTLQDNTAAIERLASALTQVSKQSSGLAQAVGNMNVRVVPISRVATSAVASSIESLYFTTELDFEYDYAILSAQVNGVLRNSSPGGGSTAVNMSGKWEVPGAGSPIISGGAQGTRASLDNYLALSAPLLTAYPLSTHSGADPVITVTFSMLGVTSDSEVTLSITGSILFVKDNS